MTHSFTAGEKALVVMLAAGFFGYWAGLGLSTPGVGVSFASAAAYVVAAKPAVAAPAPRVEAPAQDGHARFVSGVATLTARDEPWVPGF